MEQSKLYKCYKPGCNKADDTENPFLTQSEYDDLLKDGKLICPETHEICGIRELKPEEYPKKKPNINNKLFVLGGSLLGVILIIVLIIIFTGKKEPNQKIQEPTPVVQQVTQGEPTTIADKEKAVASEEKVNSSVNTLPKTSTDKKSNKSLEFSFGYYKGETKNGLRDGQGVMTFTEKYLISPKDLKKRYAEAGDYISGTWVEGNIVNGKLFDKNGEQKETLLIGH